MHSKTLTATLSQWFIILMIAAIPAAAMGQHAHHSSHDMESPLTQPGNDVLGTIQEVITELESRPDTDWSQVNLEALRQHLLDMKAFSEGVSVVSRRTVPGGIELTVRPDSERAEEALANVLQRHPSMLAREKGWTMNATRQQEQWIITCTTDTGNENEIAKIRALGYIGLLAEGAHHQRHHWMIATGQM